MKPSPTDHTVKRSLVAWEQQHVKSRAGVASAPRDDPAEALHSDEPLHRHGLASEPRPRLGFTPELGLGLAPRLGLSSSLVLRAQPSHTAAT